MQELAEQLEIWTKEGDHILVIGDLNEYIYIQRVKSFLSRLGLRKLMLDKHSVEGPASTRSKR